ncbi:hypothetical protein N5O88_16555 [Pseudomonas sp. GD03721]|nr:MULTISPECIES: hypothetical protein [unclassified Pseudomonas]MDH1443260.1 hypothetical protein [Pseudomonas sp. GD03722]WGG00690.1 hypothetical protein N5O88_16555 [Pseudomonas sp. GD03721]WGG04856.1 hypothetical protein N5O87_16565 [Pseudomonas sp. GD03919]
MLKDNKFGKVSATCPSGKMLHMLVDQLCREPEGEHDDGAEGEALRMAFIVQKIIDDSLT